jgi:hypothetical protein
MKLFAAIAATTFIFAGCQSTGSSNSKAAPGTINDGCPFSGKPVEEGSTTADWDGESVGFCCGGCAKRWNGWSDEQKNDYVAAQK